MNVPRKPRILAVDDNKSNLRMLNSMLASEDYDIIEAHDGEEALALVPEVAPDLIITDVIMPKMDGFKLVEALRADPESAPIPVLMVTSLHELKIKLRGLEVGADDFLSKPFISVELRARVRSLLRIKHLHDELETKNKLLERVLTRYISEDIAAAILSDPDQNLRLGGESCEVSVLFADIRGFTNFSEQHSASQVTDMLNHIFEALTQPVFEYDGTLDKYLGDAIMAFYGAPIPTHDYPERALRTGWAMQQRFAELSERLPLIQGLGIGVGICTGEVIVGNIGSERLMDYTVIGQTANMAKRLQEHAQAGQILIEQRTYDAVREQVDAAPVEVPSLRAYRQLTRIYEVRGLDAKRSELIESSFTVS
jgi:class 3 adenylate cyclase